MKVIYRNGEAEEMSFEEQGGKEAFWHTTAHVLAQAVKRLYPESKCAIGPAIDNGFYYDFEFSFSFSEEQLEEIEEEMKRIVRESLSVQVSEMSREEALSYMEEHEEPYKSEMIRELPEGEVITFYRQGEYAESIAAQLKESGYRVEVDRRDEKLGYKIREAQLDKVPYMLILGEKELSHGSVSVRQRDGQPGKQDLGEMSQNEFLKLLG